MKKRVLVIISFSFSIRYIYRTKLLNELKKFSHPVIAITWNQEDLIKELQEEGFEVHVIPESKKNANYNDVRKKIDFWFNHFKLKTPSKKIQEDWLETLNDGNFQWLTFVRKKYNIIKFYFPNTIKQLKKKEKKLLLSDTNYKDISTIIDNLKLDAVFTVTPFHTQEDVLLQVCKHKGIKMITSILSFDNITKRGWLPVDYDLYMVWNKYNKNEIIRCYKKPKKHINVEVVGAAQFDFYYDKKYLIDKEKWLQNVGLPNDGKKIILYAGGPKSLFPEESNYLKIIDEAICNGLIEGSPKILFRCHPVDDVNRWKEKLQNCSHVFFDTSWTGQSNLLHANITNNDISKLCSTLYHTDIHINLCSTMTVDGSVFKKPQIAPAYDFRGEKESKLLRNMYYQEHFLPIMRVDGVALARTENELIKLINAALINESSASQKFDKVIEEIITYNDGQSTNRVVEEIKKIMLN